jgi:hypothetical protein
MKPNMKSRITLENTIQPWIHCREKAAEMAPSIYFVIARQQGNILNLTIQPIARLKWHVAKAKLAGIPDGSCI